MQTQDTASERKYWIKQSLTNQAQNGAFYVKQINMTSSVQGSTCQVHETKL